MVIDSVGSGGGSAPVAVPSPEEEEEATLSVDLNQLDDVYNGVIGQLYQSSYVDACDRYNELKALLEKENPEDFLEEINQKFNDFKTLSKGGSVDGQRWTFATSERQKQTSMNALNSLVLAGNLAAERNRFALLESQQKSMEKALNSPDENIQKGVFSTSVTSRSEHFEKEMKEAQDLTQRRNLKTIEEGHLENERIRPQEGEKRDDPPPPPYI
ncbi:MAG: hypothetical protein LBR62_01100 [Puniceicoccales bacterium]|jgi:hypothetical protein|nr:hypothetical protein [Puniceicoccales bacterium]